MRGTLAFFHHYRLSAHQVDGGLQLVGQAALVAPVNVHRDADGPGRGLVDVFGLPYHPSQEAFDEVSGTVERTLDRGALLGLFRNDDLESFLSPAGGEHLVGEVAK